MKSRSATLSPALLGGLFFGIAVAGVVFLGWGEARLAFVLLIYCLVIIGARLDHIARLLERIERKLAAAASVRAAASPDPEPPPPESQSPP